MKAQELSGEDEEDEVSSTSSSVPPSAIIETQRKAFTAVKSKDKPDLLKKKKPRSMLPVSTAMDHRPKEDLLQDCITLASVKHNSAPPAGCVPGQGEHIHLGLFSDRQALYRMFEAEEEGHVEAGHFESVVYLRLWSGDLEGALQLATEKGELNDHLLSLAPMAGFQVWSRTVEAFVKQLCLQEQYLKAASHLLSINKLYEAIDLLRSHKLYREAIALVKARLPAEEPVLKELYTCWAAVLERDGHFSAAAKCYLAAGASFDAAKVIARKNDVSSLSTAASLARISGEVALAQSLALRCAKDLAAAQDWAAAQEVLSSQESLLVHRLHLCVAELLAVMLADPQAASPPCVSTNLWASPGERHISIHGRVKAVWEEQFGVSQTSAGHRSVKTLLQELKSLESPTPTANIPLRQVQLYSSLHLTRAVLSWLSDDDGQLIKELWQAVAWFRDAGHFCVSAELCRLLFPDGKVTVCSLNHPKVLQYAEEEAKAAADSLGAFVHYHRLYQHWWSNPTQIQSRCSLPLADCSRGEEVEEKVVNGEGDVSESGESVSPETRTFDDLDLGAYGLLSERHATCQASQRSVREIQERIAALVLRHSRAQVGQLDSGEKEAADRPLQLSSSREGSADAEQRPEEQETLLSLSTKMSEHQKQLADLPNTIKMYPHPDVVECCLVLLHISKSSSLSESLQQKAKDLLRKYGTNPSVLKTAQKFLT